MAVSSASTSSKPSTSSSSSPIPSSTSSNPNPSNNNSKSKPKNSNLVLSLLALYIGYVIYTSLSDGSIVEVPEAYWGKSDDASTSNNDISIQPFKITTENSVLKDLKQKLEQELKLIGKTSSSIANAAIESTDFIQNIAQYWKNEYNWNERIKLLNKYPHYTTVINGLQIHFQRIKPNDNTNENTNSQGQNSTNIRKNPRALLLLHGWPSSFVEFQKLVPYLTNPDENGFAFDLVIPSLPGFAFSESSTKTGLGTVAMSQIFLKLMDRLGYENFYVHGGNDWGSVIATTMATIYPVNVVGIHLHQCVSKHPKTLIRHLVGATISYLLTNDDEGLRSTNFYLEPTGINLAKPDALNVALRNSPSGLLAYILDMYSSKFKNEVGESVVNIDEILDNVMIYWLTKTIGTSSKIFTNHMDPVEQAYKLDCVVTFVPTMCTNYPNAIFVQSESYLSDKFQQILRYKEETQRDQQSSTPEAEIIASNIIESFQLLEEKGFGVINGKHTCYKGPPQQQPQQQSSQ